MSKHKVYIEPWVYDYLHQFGKMNDVINHCVNMAMKDPDIWTMEEMPPRGGSCRQVKCMVLNEEYEEFAKNSGLKDHSLRRLLYTVAAFELLDGQEVKPADKQEVNLAIIRANLNIIHARICYLAIDANDYPELQTKIMNIRDEIGEIIYGLQQEA